MSIPEPSNRLSLPSSLSSSTIEQQKTEEQKPGFIQGREKVTLVTQSGSTKIKDLSRTIQDLAKNVFRAQSQLSAHSALIVSGEEIKDKGNLEEAVRHSKENIKDIELQLAHAESGPARAKLEKDLHVLKARVETLTKQYDTLVSEKDARGAEGAMRKEINDLLLEGSKDPLKAAQNFEKAHAKLAVSDPHGTQFPELQQKMQVYAGKYLKLSSEERSMEKKLENRNFSSKDKVSPEKVSPREAKVIESLIRKHVAVLSLETDPQKKENQFEKVKNLARGFGTSQAFLKNFLNDDQKIAGLDARTRASLESAMPQTPISSMRLLLREISTEKANYFKTELQNKAPVGEGSPSTRVEVPEAKISSSEKKEAQFKIGLMTYLFNRPVGKVANKLNDLAVNNLKIEKVIEFEIKHVASKSVEELTKADNQQIKTLSTLIQQEKDALATLKSELVAKGPSRLASDVERAILKQESVVARLETKLDILKSQSGDDYKKGVNLKKSIEQFIQEALSGPEHTAESLFAAFEAQKQLASLAEKSQGPLQPELRQMNETAIARLTSPEVKEASKLTSDEAKLKAQLLKAESSKDLQTLKASPAEVRNMLAKEMLESMVSEKSSEEKENTVSQLKAQMQAWNTSILLSANAGFKEVFTTYDRFVGAEAERARLDFYTQRADVLNEIAVKGFPRDLKAKMDQLHETGASQGAHISKELEKVEVKFSAYINTRTRKTSSEKGISERLQKDRPSLKASDEKAALTLVTKNAELALSKAGAPEAKKLAEELNRLKEAAVGRSIQQRFRDVLKMNRSSETQDPKAIWNTVATDPELAKNLDVLRQQSAQRMQNILQDIGTLLETEPGKTQEQFDKLTEEVQTYTAFMLEGGQEDHAVQALSVGIEAEISKKMDRLLAHSDTEFEPNLATLQMASGIVSRGLTALPASFQAKARAQIGSSEAFKSKVEEILPRFSALFKSNANETALISSSLHQVRTLASLAQVESSKLTFLDEATIQNNFVSAHKELVSSTRRELEEGQKGYDKLLVQKEALKKILTPEEGAHLENFLEKFDQYLNQLKPIADQFNEIEKKDASEASSAQAAGVLESAAFKQLAVAIKDTLGVQQGMGQINTKAAQVIAEGRPEAKVFRDADLGVQFVLIKHPVDRFLKWPGLLDNMVKIIEKKKPEEGSQLAGVQNRFAQLKLQVEAQAQEINKG